VAFVKLTPEMAAEALKRVDWAAQDALTDADIAAQVAADPDAAPLLTAAQTVAAVAITTRKRLGLSQTAFARCYGIPLGTLRDWEQGRKRQDATALTYLRVIAKAPEMVARALEAA
jgi:putative transcriptional regulator